MDDCDIAILREMSRDRVMAWGSADPRLSANEIARTLGTPPSTVRDRLRTWSRCGFLKSTEVVPSPGLFGVGIAGTTVRVGDVTAKPQVLEDVGLVDGVWNVLDMAGPWIAVAMANEGPAALERRRRLVARIRGVDEVAACLPLEAPRCRARPSPLDWRILAALRATPKGSIHEGAKVVGVSSKTFAKRLESLIAARAVWVLPLFDFRRWSGGSIARFLVELEAGVAPRDLAPEVRERVQDAVEVFVPSSEETPGMPEDFLEVWANLPTAAAVDDVDRALRGIKGVKDNAVYWPRELRAFPGWFDERIAAALKA